MAHSSCYTLYIYICAEKCEEQKTKKINEEKTQMNNQTEQSKNSNEKAKNEKQN
jgi:hypothetical protein